MTGVPDLELAPGHLAVESACGRRHPPAAIFAR
jgi:hypothetical protein